MARTAPSVRGTCAVVLATLAVGVLSACGSSAASGASPGLSDLSGRSFVADRVEDPHHTLVRGTHVQLSFTDHTLTAQAGCNTMSGQVTLVGGVLALDDGLAMTEMGCPGPRMDQDEWVADLLTSSPRMTLEGHTLVVEKGATTLTLRELR